MIADPPQGFDVEDGTRRRRERRERMEGQKWMERQKRMRRKRSLRMTHPSVSLKVTALMWWFSSSSTYTPNTVSRPRDVSGGTFETQEIRKSKKNKAIQDGGEAKAPLWLNRLSGTN